MAYRKSHELLYAAFKVFLNRCLIGDQSLLWPDTPVWTIQNVSQVKQWIFDESLIDATLSFEEKLALQLQHGSPVHWMLIADLFYIYFLPSSQMLFTKRIDAIRSTANKARIDLPPENSAIWQAQQRGFSKTGLRYHQKYRQFWLILLFAEWIKSQPNPIGILADRKQVQIALDTLLETQVQNKNDRAYDMRSAILYLMFPDFYEPIISTSDKISIIKAYGNRVSNIAKLDRDEALFAIRNAFSGESDNGAIDEPFSFYQDGMKEEWRSVMSPVATISEAVLHIPMSEYASEVENVFDYPVSIEEPISEDVNRVLRAFTFTRNLILYGPPGTGKTFVARKVAEELVESQLLHTKPTATTGDTFISWVTFHQSYSYEDFIEGLRPVAAEDGSLSYEIVKGAFLSICDTAMHDPQNKYIIVIDEINRGNIAKIFGELITLLEDDKRSTPDKESLKIRLTYSRTPFSIPENVYVLGTMNTADRSIALLDIALRRRFAFVELMPRPKLLGDTTIDTAETSLLLSDLLHNLNQGIKRDLGRDYQIGHSYFLKVANKSQEDMVEALEFVWRNQVLPLLKEYYYSQPDKLATLLRIKDANNSINDGLAGFELDAMNRDDIMNLLGDIANSNVSTGDKS